MKFPSILTLARSMDNLASAIHRAADILERAYPPPPKGRPRQVGLEAMVSYNSEADVEAELEAERLREQGRLDEEREGG